MLKESVNNKNSILAILTYSFTAKRNKLKMLNKMKKVI